MKLRTAHVLSELLQASPNKGLKRSARIWGSHPMINLDYCIVEFTTKANTLDTYSMLAINKAMNFGKPLIIINDGMQFSAGVNLNYVMELAIEGEWKKIEGFIVDFQETCLAMKYYKEPVISAPSGLAIGGGFEILAQRQLCCLTYKCSFRFGGNFSRIDSSRRRM